VLVYFYIPIAVEHVPELLPSEFAPSPRLSSSSSLSFLGGLPFSVGRLDFLRARSVWHLQGSLKGMKSAPGAEGVYWAMMDGALIELHVFVN
jgi:hypothetical protein